MEMSLKTGRSDPVTIKEEFPCLPVFLHTLETEYQLERTRAERLDGKAMGLMTVILALITVYVPIFPLNDCAKVYTAGHCGATVFFSLFLLAGLFGIGKAIYSAHRVIGVYRTQEYQGVDIEVLNADEKLGQERADKYHMDTIGQYRAAILKNGKINDGKAAALSAEFGNVIWIFILLSVSAIGMLICVGLC